MTTRNAVIVGAGLAAAALVYAIWLYPSLPERIPIHWDLHGRVDGWGAKSWAAYFGPGMMALFTVLTVVFPWLSSGQFAVESFRGTFNYVMVLVVGLLGYIHGVMLQAALHPEWASGRWLVGGLFLFFALLGNVLGKTRPNFWMGVRTPWTLANEAVWVATHRLAGRLMVATGILCGPAVLLGAPTAPCFFLLMAALLIPVFYSLVLYKRYEREGHA
jgi:uncharacterized membrane protein